MADRNVTAAAQHFAAEEAAAESGCARAATAHGLTADQAEACDDGDQGCPQCPWRRTAGVPASAAPRYFCNKCGTFPAAVHHNRPDGTQCPYIARVAAGVQEVGHG